jgi:hypothetical protein
LWTCEQSRRIHKPETFISGATMTQALYTPSPYKPDLTLASEWVFRVRQVGWTLAPAWDALRRFSATLHQLSYRGDPVLMGMLLTPGGVPCAAATLVIQTVQKRLKRRRAA